MTEIQKRGQWRSHRSLSRYEKSARLASSLIQFHPLQQECFETCERRAEEIVLRGRLTLLPPQQLS